MQCGRKTSCRHLASVAKCNSDPRISFCKCCEMEFRPLFCILQVCKMEFRPPFCILQVCEMEFRPSFCILQVCEMEFRPLFCILQVLQNEIQTPEIHFATLLSCNLHQLNRYFHPFSFVASIFANVNKQNKYHEKDIYSLFIVDVACVGSLCTMGSCRRQNQNRMGRAGKPCQCAA